MSLIKSLIISLILLIALAGGYFLKPEIQVLSAEQMPNFEKIIPSQFGSWRLDDALPMILGDPGQLALLDEIYSQNISRTYIGNQGQHLMLAVAYGYNQSDEMQVHKPEVCYPAQGFKVLNKENGVLTTDQKTIPVTYLKTQKGPRIEFVTYWILVGDQVVQGDINRKLQQLSFGLKGVIPDGLLFRVSTIGATEAEFDVQKSFIKEMLNSLDKQSKEKLIGVY